MALTFSQEVVADLVSSKETGRSSAPDSRDSLNCHVCRGIDGLGIEFWLRHTSTPYLIGTALRLADACDVIDAVVGSAALQAGISAKSETPQIHFSAQGSLLFGDAMQERCKDVRVPLLSCFPSLADWKEHHRASTCQFMAPDKAGGGLTRSLELQEPPQRSNAKQADQNLQHRGSVQDPFVLLHLSGLSYQLSATESEGSGVGLFSFRLSIL